MASLTELPSVYAPTVEIMGGPSLRLTTALAQASSGQDFVTHGGTGDSPWMVVADGHGEEYVINEIRHFDFDTVLNGEQASEVIERVQEKTNGVDSEGFCWKGGSGSTLSVVEIDPDNIKITWLGDSHVIVLEDGVEVFRTKSHDGESDRAMLGSRATITSWRMSLTSAHEIVPVMSPYIVHGAYDKCNIVRALGHGGHCVNTPDIHIVPRIPGKTYRVIAASDGFWDMVSDSQEDKNQLLTGTASFLCNLAKYRWQQEWRYRTPHGVSPQRFSDKEWDDVVVAVWDSA